MTEQIHISAGLDLHKRFIIATLLTDTGFKERRGFERTESGLFNLKEFHSLSHFKRELWTFDRQYNHRRKQEILDWMTPASVYHNEINFNKNRKLSLSGHKLCQQNGH
jgi:hypothetical protein